MKLAKSTTPLVAIMALGLSTAASAQSGASASNSAAPPAAVPAAASNPEPKFPVWQISLTPRGQVDFQGDLKDGPGSVKVYRGGAALEIGAALSPQWSVGVGLDAEFSSYDFKNATTLIAGTADPFDDVAIIRLTPTVGYRIDNRWSVTGGAFLEFAGEGDADIGETFTGGGFAAVRHACSETFAISLGIAAKSQLEDDVLVIPLVGIEWQITPDVRFATRALGGELAMRLNDQWSIAFEARYDLRVFRLGDDNVLPEGVVRDRRIPIGAVVRWKPCERVRIELRGGATVWQEFQIDDRNGVEQSEIETKPTPYVGLAVEFRF